VDLPTWALTAAGRRPTTPPSCRRPVGVGRQLPPPPNRGV